MEACADRALSVFDLDSRAEVKAAQRAFLLATFAFAVLLVVPVAVALGLRAAPSAIVIAAWLLPICGAAGVHWRSTSCLRLVCCCTPVLVIVFCVGAFTLVGQERPRFECICDPSCDALPSAGGLGGGGGGGGRGGFGRFGGGGGGNAGNLTDLRASAQYVLECGEKGAVEAAFGLYPAIGALAFALQVAACVFSCRITNFWREHGVTASPLTSSSALQEQQQQRQPAGAVSYGLAQLKPDMQVVVPVGMSIRTRGGLQLVSYAPTGGGGGGGGGPVPSPAASTAANLVV